MRIATYKSVTWMLIVSMAAIAIVTTGASILILYRTAYAQTLSELQESAGNLAGVMEAVAQFDQRFSTHAHPQGARGATLSQIEQGLREHQSTYRSEELTLGWRVGDNIQIMRRGYGESGINSVATVPFSSALAEPLRRALRGERGNGELLDYGGKTVLAGYAPVPTLKIGLVYKIHLDEMRQPYLRAALWAGGATLLGIVFGAVSFLLFIRPIRRRAEEGESRLRAILSGAPVGVYETDVLGHCIYVNEEWCALTGLRPDQAAGEGWQQALHPDDRALIFSAWSRFVAGQAPFRLEYRMLRPDGRIAWVYGQASVLKNSAGAITGYSGIITDISKQKNNQITADLALTRLNEAQRMAKVGSWELDLARNAFTCSDEILHMFEIDRGLSAVSREVILQAIHPDDREAVSQAYSNSLVDRKSYNIVHRLMLADGRIKYMRESCVSYFDADGKPLRSIGTVQDISDRIAIEHDLDTFKTTLDQTLDCVFMFDAETMRFIYVNQGAINQVGYSRDELLQMTPIDIKPLIEEAEFRALLTPLLTGELSELRFETVHRHKLGKDTPVGIFLQYVQPAGERPRYVAIVRDISEQLRAVSEMLRLNESLESRVSERTRELESAKETAERANRAKNDFLSRMSHELRTPMNAILGFAQILEIERLGPDQMDYVREIHRAGDHLLELINELLDLSRIEAGKMTTVLQPVDVISVTNDASQIVQSLITEKRITLTNQCDARAMVLADPTRLKQILVNLLSNAAKYNRQNGRIMIACWPMGDDLLRIAVTDTGQGIAPEKLADLYKPFARLGAEFSAIDGTGIGLALSKQLAELMGGRLGLDSVPGEGSTFWVELPVVMAGAHAAIDALYPPPGNAPPVESRQARRVLYVEDNLANLRLIEAMFRHMPDLQLFSATNGEYGLELARRYRPDAILLDIHLPGMDGYTVLDELKADAATRRIPVIAFSADAMPIDIEKGYKAGFEFYLTKPVKVEELMRVLESLMDRERSAARAGQGMP